MNIFWCKNCLMASTRPRITFNTNGWCNACQWMERKKTIDWDKRYKNLKINIDKYKSSNGGYDCIVAVSGGKDGSYISYKLKSEFGLNPLTVTVRPPLETDLGGANLRNFINSGFDHIHVSPNLEVMSELNKLGFIEKGFPYYGWVIAIHTAVIRIAINFKIKLVFYAEDGEVEFGGETKKIDESTYTSSYQKKIILENSYDKIFEKLSIKDNSERYFFEFPEVDFLKELVFTHWSYYENWDPYKNYLIAKEHCGLEENKDTNIGTFTNFAQNDQKLYSLHTYLMYLKFGFGRATADACIEIRRGSMTREQGLNLIKIYDGHYPLEFLSDFLDHYNITIEEFSNVIDKFVNKDLFKKENNQWIPKFVVK